MGFLDLFKKQTPKPTVSVENYDQIILMSIESTTNRILDNIEYLKKSETILYFNKNYERIFLYLDDLINQKRNHPNYNFPVDPDELYSKLKQEKHLLECFVVDNAIEKINRKLLNYTTDKGKYNNFVKEYNIFLYDRDAMSDYSLNYFFQKTKELYPEYINRMSESLTE